MCMCTETSIKDCCKVISSQLELLKAQLEKQSVKNRRSLDLNKTSKKSMKHSAQGHKMVSGVSGCNCTGLSL